MTAEDSDKIFKWDHHSDQPHVIRNKRAKRRLYLLGAVGSIKTLLIALMSLPLAWLFKVPYRSSVLPAAASAIGLGINVESALAEKTRVSHDALQRYVEELGVDHLLLRVPLGESDSLKPYLALANRFASHRLLIDVMQDRKHIENRVLLEEHLRHVFNAFSTYSNTFKIGNAVNRRKWAFQSLDEYFAFFGAAQRLRDKEFPQLELLGGSIIDFELPNFARSLLHLHPIRYDAVAALLYVDRRGAPESRQMGVDLLGKISWFRSLMRLSNKCEKRLWITEVNWPLLNTEPFAPAVGACMVDEHRQASYLARYYLLAFASGQVEAVFWHQLVAPGYGLIDNRGDNVRPRRAFYALKTLTQLFSQATITGFQRRGEIYLLTAEREQQHLTAVWTNDRDATLKITALPSWGSASRADAVVVYDLTGEKLETSDSLAVSGDVTYVVKSLRR